ncbi:beta-secretase 1-like [Ptychodera flava]|uniref:beta-secretase 1-like n=1 Tax=Ptychodera flava TaxID=63121 RepID=UPI00396A1C79
MATLFLFILLQLVVLQLPTVSDGEVLTIPMRKARSVVNRSQNLNRVPLSPTTEEPSTENNLRGKPGQGYYIELSMGAPPQSVNVLVDTGSSNFAVASAPHPFIARYFNTDKSSTYINSGIAVDVPYTQGRWDGYLGTDLVALSAISNVTARVNIASITKSENFFINGSNWEGILGLAYDEIARPDSSLTPFFDSYASQTAIDDIFTLQLCGSTDKVDSSELGGTMTVGGLDDTLYSGEVFYTSIIKEWYYEIIIVDIEVDDISLNLDCKEYNFDKTIVDSGTTNFRVPVKVFDALVHAIDDATPVEVSPEFYTGTELMCWSDDTTPWEHFPSVKISLLAEDSSQSFKLLISPKQYMRKVDDGTSEADDCYKFAITTSSSGSVIGAVIMEGFYVIFDRHNKRIGFAASTCAEREATYVTPQVMGPYPHNNSTGCAYEVPESNETTLMAVAYAMASICAICMLPLLVMLFQCYRKGSKEKKYGCDSENLVHQ